MSKKKQIKSHFTSIVINSETGEVLKEHPIKEKDLIVIKKQFIKLFIDDNVKDIRHQYESFLQSIVMKYIDYRTNKLRILTNQNRHKPLRIKDITIFLNISHRTASNFIKYCKSRLYILKLNNYLYVNPRKYLKGEGICIFTLIEFLKIDKDLIKYISKRDKFFIKLYINSNK